MEPCPVDPLHTLALESLICNRGLDTDRNRNGCGVVVVVGRMPALEVRDWRRMFRVCFVSWHPLEEGRVQGVRIRVDSCHGHHMLGTEEEGYSVGRRQVLIDALGRKAVAELVLGQLPQACFALAPEWAARALGGVTAEHSVVVVLVLSMFVGEEGEQLLRGR